MADERTVHPAQFADLATPAEQVHAPSHVTIKDWLLSDLKLPSGVASKPDHTHPWWQVMCLTGVDYFSTLGYQPGIAFLAAGLLSPVATLVLVLVTLFGALPVYMRVAAESPNGQGSISMLERLLPKWKGKALVLVLLGFAATDFVITITLSSADGAAHLIENPFVPGWMRHQIIVTVVLLLILGAVFLKGFKEAIGLAVALVGIYLVLNFIVVSTALVQLFGHPGVLSHWSSSLWQQHGSPLGILGVSLIVFPRLALGLSGFETGVAVMPLVGGGSGVRDELAGRIGNTRKLLVVAAAIMSVFLMASSIVTALLIDPKAFRPGGPANGRALAYLAHQYLGNGFGTVYDISTIAILSFAGASAMAGLLNLVPRYLPRYGMAPEWARASKPLVLVFTLIALAITFIFRADVDAQGGAYATGVLVLITSAAIAVTLQVWKSKLRIPFGLITLVFVYTTALNVAERPEGIKIASFFIGLTILLSLVSRALRATELRITHVQFDEPAEGLLAEDPDQVIRIVARRPANHDKAGYDWKDYDIRCSHNIPENEKLFFLEIEPGDASDFDATLHVTGLRIGEHDVLRATSPAVPNAIAAVLIKLHEMTGKLPHAYFSWSEGNPVEYLFRFIFLGEGDVPPVTHEVLRRAIPDPKERPYVHVG